jgi:hypothetical protein
MFFFALKIYGSSMTAGILKLVIAAVSVPHVAGRRPAVAALLHVP